MESDCLVQKCGSCGRTITISHSWHGPIPPGVIRCVCGASLRLQAFVPEALVRPALEDHYAEPVPDLQSQLEELRDAVWDAEADWRFMDRLEVALKNRRRAA